MRDPHSVLVLISTFESSSESVVLLESVMHPTGQMCLPIDLMVMSIACLAMLYSRRSF